MSKGKKAVYYFCMDSKVDPVASNIFKEFEKLCELENTNIMVDEKIVQKYVDSDNNEFYFVRTIKPVSHDYNHYLPIMNRYFEDFDMAGVVNWHQGENAPDRVLCVHTTGDVNSGNYGAAEPRLMRNLLLALEKNRIETGLLDFSVVTEATHWSGIIYNNGGAEMIPQYKVPLVDIEIGSTPMSWNNTIAAKVVAASLLQVFRGDDKKVYSILCAGGIHFEHAFINEVLKENSAIAISHILPNQWLVAGNYEDENGLDKLQACLKSINGGVQGIVFHDGLKGIYKNQIREIAGRFNIPAFKHQLLRRVDDINWNK